MERPVLKIFRRSRPHFRIPGSTRLLLPLAALLSACAVTPPTEDRTSVAAPARTGSLVAPPGEGLREPLYDGYPGRDQESGPLPRNENLWDRISSGLQLERYYDRPEVREQVRLYASRPDYFEQVGERARPFLHNIVQQIEQRGMPMEIALIPFVESEFNLHARSSRAAVGPWQFMADTGRSLGLRVDEWFDGRKDPILATTAALDYLEIQQQRFEGNWLLTFAAYNSGPAAVGRAVRAHAADAGSIEFWDLPLPAETRKHIPRVLALASMLSGSGQTDFKLPDIADEEALKQVKLGGGASLSLAAELAGLETENIRSLNPGFRQWWTPLDGGPDFVHLPAENAEALRLALQRNPAALQSHSIRLQVRPGDSLWAISRRYGVTLEDLLRWNSLEADQLIFPGQMLRIAPPTERLQ